VCIFVFLLMMRKVFSHIATLLIASVMILATGGFSLYEHFCTCSKETHTSFFAEGEHCCTDQSTVGSRQSAVGHLAIESYHLSVEGATCCDNSELRTQNSELVNISEAENCCSIENHLNTQNSKLNSEHCSGNCCDDEVKFFKLTEPYTFSNTTLSFKSPVKDLEDRYHIILKEIVEDAELVTESDRNGFFPPPNTIKRLSFLQQFKLSPPSFA